MHKWQFYLREAETQAEFAELSYQAFRKAEAKAAVIEVFYHLHHFLVHAASIDRILDPEPGSERAAILLGHLDLGDLDLKPFRRLRNHLEHFDERLDQWVRNYDGHAFFDMNIITGAKGFPKKAYLRALDGDIFRFHGESYSMSDLHDAVVEIHRRLTKAFQRTSATEAGPS